MAVKATLAKAGWSAGEVSPELYGDLELAKNQVGLEIAENVLVLVGGGITRRPGTEMITALKTESQPGKLITWRYGPTTAYTLIINGGVARIMANGAPVLSGGSPYELPVPYTADDLDNLRWTSSGDFVVLVAVAHRPQALTRTGDAAWSLAGYANVGGPVGPQNLDKTKTITASGVTGVVTLHGANIGWQAGHVGGVWRLDEADLTVIPLWKADETITLATASFTGTASGNLGDMSSSANAFDGNASSTASKATSTTAYIGRVWATGQPVFYVTLRGHPTTGLEPFGPGIGTVTLRLLAKNGSPAHELDGTELGTLTVTGNRGDTFTVYSSNTVALWTHIWIVMQFPIAVTWTVGEMTFVQFTTAETIYRRWQGRVYQALTGGNTGVNPPTHTSDAVYSGPNGINWLYCHRDRGFVRITAVVDADTATAEVLETLPYSCTERATYRWWPAAWDGVEGWPSAVALGANCLTFTRGDRFWRTKPGSFFDFDTVDPTDAGQALSGRILSDRGSLVQIEWIAQASGIVLGSREDEFVLRAGGLFDPLSAANARTWPDQSIGSAPQVLCRIDGGALFIHRSRRRLYHALLDPQAERIAIDRVDQTANHILAGRLTRIAYQEDPGNVAWGVLADGTLVSVTYVRGVVAGWCRHPMTNGHVEDVATIASADEGESEVYMIVRRSVNGVTRRFVERLSARFQPADPEAPTAAGAWFVDCGRRWTGAAATVIPGFGHLIGEELVVLADGANAERVTVAADGTITLRRRAADVIAGLPIVWRVRLLPLDLMLPTGPTIGRAKRANRLRLRLLHAAGAAITVNPDEDVEPEWLDQTGSLAYGRAIPLKSGLQTVVLQVPTAQPDARGVQGNDCTVEIGGDDAMPFTLTALYPDVEAEA